VTAVVELSVVIPTCGRAATLRRTLSALLQPEFDLTRAELIVVSDGPDPPTGALVMELARDAPCAVRLLEQPRQGQGRARNRGIAAAAGRVVLMLDDDIAAAPGLLAAHARRHDNCDDVVVTGALPMALVEPEPAHCRVVREWWDSELRELASPHHVASFRDFVTGNVSVPRARLLEVGGFDEAFTGYGREDYELGFRLHRAGLRFVHEPRAIGVHHYDKPAIAWLRQFSSMGRADVIFARKHPSSVDEVMGLSLFPRWPGIARAIPMLERFVLRRNDRGGRLWGTGAALTQGAHYWAGIESEVSDARELEWLVAAHRRNREASLRTERERRGGSLLRRLWRRAEGALRSGELPRKVARALGRAGLP